MMSPKEVASDPRITRSPPIRQTPLQVIHVLGNFMRIWSVYALYHHLSHRGDSVILFIFSCLVPASIIFLLLQKPWKGRPLPNSQVVPTVINGVIMALFLILWGKGLLSCGPLMWTRNRLDADRNGAYNNTLNFAIKFKGSITFLSLLQPHSGFPIPFFLNFFHLFFLLSFFNLLFFSTLLSEYAGAVLGVLSALLYGRRVSIWKKVGGLLAMSTSFYFLSIGWATRTYSPFYSIGSERVDQAKQSLGFKEMTVPILAGILSALRRVMARRASLKNQLKRRLHAITVASAACFLFPLAMWDTILGSESNSIANFQFMSWACLSTIFFGIVLIFYIDNLAEERLHLVFSSPRHLMVATGCIIVMEILYKMDFSLLGFLICSSVLAFGIFEATSLERLRRSSVDAQEISDGTFENNLQMSSLPS